MHAKFRRNLGLVVPLRNGRFACIFVKLMHPTDCPLANLILPVPLTFSVIPRPVCSGTVRLCRIFTPLRNSPLFAVPTRHLGGCSTSFTEGASRHQAPAARNCIGGFYEMAALFGPGPATDGGKLRSSVAAASSRVGGHSLGLRDAGDLAADGNLPSIAGAASCPGRREIAGRCVKKSLVTPRSFAACRRWRRKSTLVPSGDSGCRRTAPRPARFTTGPCSHRRRCESPRWKKKARRHGQEGRCKNPAAGDKKPDWRLGRHCRRNMWTRQKWAATSRWDYINWAPGGPNPPSLPKTILEFRRLAFDGGKGPATEVYDFGSK